MKNYYSHTVGTGEKDIVELTQYILYVEELRKNIVLRQDVTRSIRWH
jgi:hypothetical protein